jgi:hypothetical protein
LTLATYRGITQLVTTAPLFAADRPLVIRDHTDIGSIISGTRKRFVVPVRQPMVLISQVQRSGGTLIAQLLDGHPELHVHPRELHIGRPNKTYWPNLDLSDRDADKLFRQLREKWIARAVEAGFEKLSGAEKAANPEHANLALPFIFWPKLQRAIFCRLAADAWPTRQREALDAYATSFFNAWIDYQSLYRPPSQVRYWVAFIARLLVRPSNLDGFAADYPDGKIIVPVRDPVSWYASASRHSAEYADVHQAADLWLAANRAALEAYRRLPARVLFVEHRRVVQDTQAVMQTLAGFLGISFSRTMLTPTFNGMLAPSDSSFGARLGLDPRSADRRDLVSEDDRCYLERAASSVYADLLRLAEDQSGAFN